MAYKLVKFYPDNFSSDITTIVSAITLKHGKRPFLYGSGSYKINYPSDYDLAQEVPVNNHILKDVQEVVEKLLKLTDVFIGDIKSGEIPDLKVIDDDLNEKNYNSKMPTMINKINKLASQKNITKEERDEAISLLKPNLTEMDLFIIKHEIRYEVIRWKAQDILNGFVNYRGHKIMFNKYLLGDNLTKIDVITWLNGVRYNEITMVYVFSKNGVFLNQKFGNIELALTAQIPYLIYKKKFMKICKRINSIERASDTPNKLILRRFNRLFNSDLGLLNQIISDITNLEFLVENVKAICQTKFEYEIDQIRYRLGNMTNLKYIKKQQIILKLLKELEKDVMNVDILDKFRQELFDILEPETMKVMKKYKLLPIPKEYLPIELRGKGVIDTIVKGINYVSNLFPSSDKYATEIEAGEKHGVLILPNGKLGRSNYMGPGTNLLKRLKRGDKPRTEMDELSRAHDIRYDLAQSQADIEEADEVFIKGAKKIRKEKKDNIFNTYVGQVPIQAKLYAEKKGLIKPMFKKSPKLTEEDEALMRSTLKDAIAKGYGANQTISLKKKDLLREHTKLISILKSGNKAKQLREANDQQKEMKKYVIMGSGYELDYVPIEDYEMTI